VTLRVTALALVLLAGHARADEPQGPVVPPGLREAYEQGDYEAVRRELLKAYAIAPKTEYLFALGQVELNLGNYEAAIRYYEQFIARGPSEEQIALAQQAIGAARMRMATPKPAPPPPPPPPPEPPYVPPREWYVQDTWFVAAGGAAIALGGGLLYYSHHLGDDHSGTLSEYDDRVRLSRTTMWSGIGLAAAGTIVIGVTLVRWRLRPDGPDLSASIGPGAGTFVLTGRW
jgi:tetratricopeptide (TPR) repeat protein